MILPGPSLSPLGASRRRRSSGGGGAGVALVQQVSAKLTRGGSTAKTLTIAAPAAGSALRLWYADPGGATISSITGGGVTWSRLLSIGNFAGATLDLWAGDNSSGGGTTLTITVSATYATHTTCFSEWSGMPATAAPDPAPAYQTSTGSNVSTPSVTPTAGASVLLMAAVQPYPYAHVSGPTNGFTGLTPPAGDGGNVAIAYLIVPSASGSYSCGWGLSASYASSVGAIAGWDGA